MSGETNERGVPSELVDKVAAAAEAGFAKVCVVCGHGLDENGVGDHFRGCSVGDLVELARRATPGPWRWGRGEADDGDWPETWLVTVEKRETWGSELRYSGDQTHETVVLNEDSPWGPKDAANRAFVAACSPEKVIALADKVDALTRVLSLIRDGRCECGYRFKLGEQAHELRCEGCGRMDEPVPRYVREMAAAAVAG